MTKAGWLQPVELDDYLEQPDPKVVWLVRGLVPASSLVMLSGPRKRAYKTYFVFLMVLLYVYGMDFWEWPVEQPGNALILEEESTQAENKQRFRNLKHGLKLHGKKKPGKLFFQLHGRFKLDNPKMVTDLIAYIKTNEVKLVVLDALTYMITGDPNSTRDMTVVTSSIQDIRAQTGATVLWLAHTTKESDKVDADPDNDVRNSSVLADVYDAHIAVRRKKKRVLTVYTRFKAWAEKELEMFWNFPPENADGSYASGPIYPDVSNVTGDKRSLDIIARLVEGGWMAGTIYPMAAFRSATGLSSGAAASTRAQLISMGKLVMGPDGQGVGLPGASNGQAQKGRGQGEGDRSTGVEPSPPSPEGVPSGGIRQR